MRCSFLINLSSRVRVQWLVWLSGGRWCARAAARSSRRRWSWWPPRCWSTVQPQCWPALVCHWVSLNYWNHLRKRLPDSRDKYFDVNRKVKFVLQKIIIKKSFRNLNFLKPFIGQRSHFVDLKCRPQVRIYVYLPVCVCQVCPLHSLCGGVCLRCCRMKTRKSEIQPLTSSLMYQQLCSVQVHTHCLAGKQVHTHTHNYYTLTSIQNHTCSAHVHNHGYTH